jgi:ElaB/YqjD/DUF883 family membrane-anchored ribosome-binding protein
MRTEQANERLAGDLKAVVRDAGELLKGAADQPGEIVAKARNRLAAAVDAANATCQRLEDKTAAAAAATDRCIRTHPYETIGVFCGLGLLIGVLIGRK